MQAFYNNDNVPKYIIERTDTLYESMPLDELRARGFWNRRLEKFLPYLPDNTWIAGGFLRALIAGEDDRNGDIDFFFGTSGAFNKILSIIKDRPEEYNKSGFNWYSLPDYNVSINKLRAINCVSDIPYRPDLQLVKLWYYTNPEHVIDNFDFTVCQLAVDCERIYFNPQTFEDIKTKTIRLHRPTGSALSVFNRVLKYREKGYNIAPELFEQLENEAIKLLDKPDEINEYFYTDKDASRDHKKIVSFMHRTWEYLENAPKSAGTYRKMLEKRKRPLPKRIQRSTIPIELGSS